MPPEVADAAPLAAAPTGDVERLRRERERFIAFSFCRADLLIELDSARIVSFAAGPTSAVFGYPSETLVGKPFSDLIGTDDRPLVQQLLRTADRGQRVRDASVRLVSASGAMSPPFELNGYRFNDLDGHYFMTLRVAQRDRSDVEGRDRETGLVAGDCFAEQAAERVKSLRAAGEDAHVTLLNIPELDALRERLGTAAERELLESLAQRIQATSVDGETAARIGDSAFGLVHDSSIDVASLQFQIEAIARESDPTGEGVSVDFATADVSDPGTTPEDLAMGLVFAINQFRESQGQLTMQSLCDKLSTLADEAASYAANFSAAVGQAEFDLVFQPIVDIRTGGIHHFEVLTRFRSTVEESPFRMITFAEETGRIHEFDIAVVHKVVDWLRRVPINKARTRLAVNISGHSIENAEYARDLRGVLTENQWLNDKLLFEVTESARISDLKAANAFIQALRQLGYEVCLDDFGAGAASFQYLSSIDIDVVKLDGSAIANAQQLPKGKAFLSALTELCRKLRIETIAEMIETPEDLKFVRDCGVDYIQGYLIGKPDREVTSFSKDADPQLFPEAGR